MTSKSRLVHLSNFLVSFSLLIIFIFIGIPSSPASAAERELWHLNTSLLNTYLTVVGCKSFLIAEKVLPETVGKIKFISMILSGRTAQKNDVVEKGSAVVHLETFTPYNAVSSTNNNF